METAIVSMICIALIVVGGMTMSQNFLSSVDTTTTGLEEITERGEEIMKTELSALSSSRPWVDLVDVVLRNSGQTKLSDFARWDVIVQYHDSGGHYYIKWLPYVDGTLNDNEWTKKGIYLNAANQTAEVFEPGILNPGEEIVIEAKLNPPVGIETTNLLVASTPNGIPASITFPD